MTFVPLIAASILVYQEQKKQGENNPGTSVFAMALFHTMINISPYLIPDYGSY